MNKGDRKPQREKLFERITPLRDRRAPPQARRHPASSSAVQGPAIQLAENIKYGG
ncbi:hypothetical protein L842_2012 [Mycobacterium intracellulare MIN_052511_1280]|nr:hypothetical protein L842_2012 [Mycobacterium intracellulare MIN_052511_1280]